MKTIPILPGIALRELRTADAADIFAAIDGERAYLGRWLPLRAVHPQRGGFAAFRPLRTRSSLPRSVFTIRDGERFIGLIGLVDRSACPHHRNRLLAREAWQGRGIVTTAVRALCRMAREELAMRCVAIKCATGNGPSNRIPQRLGFTLDHVEHRAELLEDGRYTDANVYLLNLADRNTSVRP